MRIFTLIPIFLFGVLPLSSPAQQVPFLSHYSWNPRLFNPASQGAGNTGELALVYRNQFSQLDASVRPNTYLAHADFSSFLNNRIGLAIQLLGDKAHVLNRFQISGFFGYHLVQNDRMRFSLGATLGYLNQNFDFEGVRVGDLQDLSLFDNRVNAGRLDGGPGLAFEYYLPGGSLIALDAAASQLFSSDIRIREASGNGAVYDIVPHLLANGRFRLQLDGFSIEPNIIFRAMSGDRPLQAGIIDFNLNAYFLKNNRLMVGGGIRSDAGGFHLQIGVAPARNTRINLSGELHPSLGATFEVGASYTFDQNRQKPNLVQGPYQKAKEIANGFNFRVSAIKTEQDAIENAISSSANLAKISQRTTASDQCAALLAQTERTIHELRPVPGLIQTQHVEAEKIVRNAEIESREISEDTRNDLKSIVTLQVATENEVNALLARQLELTRKCTALRPEINELNCIKSGDAACLEELFTARLQQQAGNPVSSIFPLQINTSPGNVSLGYRFPNDEESYTLTPDIRNLATHIASLVNELTQQGIRLDAISLVTELQEDESTLQYNPGITYAGDLKDELPAYTLVDNKTGARSERQVSADEFTQLSLEQVGALKLSSLKSYLIQLGIPADRISLTLRYNHPENTYREETRVVLRLRS